MRNPFYNRAIFVLSMVGLLIAGALWNWHSHPVDIPCGATSHDCIDVANSKYSRLPVGTGPPIAMYGTLGYLAILALSFIRTLPTFGGSDDRDRWLRKFILLGALVGVGFSLRLTYMEINHDYIGKICLWCMTSQALILMILAISIAEIAANAGRGRGRAAAVLGGNF